MIDQPGSTEKQHYFFQRGLPDHFSDRETIEDGGMNGIVFHDLPEFEKIAVGLGGAFTCNHNGIIFTDFGTILIAGRSEHKV